MSTIITEIAYTIEAEEEYVPIRGNAIASGDDDYDQKIEDELIEESSWNPWAWCCVKVTASYGGFTGYTYLGCCSYKDEEDFKQGGYYEDMCEDAKDDLMRKLKKAHKAYEELMETSDD